VRITDDYRIAWLVIIGTIPIGILGLLLEDTIQTVARNLWLIATTLIVFGLLLGLAERVGRQQIELKKIPVRTGILLGFAQAMALIPGVSRSGGTITAGLFLGLTRPAIVRYSFLLAIPAVFAAGIFQIPDVFVGDGPTPLQMIVATVISFGLGYVTIAWLMGYIEKHSVYLFVWYRVALGIVLYIALSLGWLSAY
jgi:undecaprenyl-diphosphatase